jgi:mono/diheme cytochrome c family protein
MLRGGESGAALVPGEPDESNLLMAIRHDGWEMPPDGKLPDAEIEAIAEWVRQGAPWPGSKTAAELLELAHPGISDVRRDEHGAILLDIDDAA